MAEQKTQAMPQGESPSKSDTTKAPLGTAGKSGGGESAGGAYPNPHTGKEKKGGQDWHGGQSETAYHGSGQLGDEKTAPDGNPNSGSRS